MKYDELKAIMTKQGTRRKPRHIEEDIQIACVNWFRYTFKNYLILSVPNGGSRNAREAANMKRSGTLAGASDLIIVAERAVLFIEMKTEKNKQTALQVSFQQAVERLGHTYAVCHSLQEFQLTVERFLKERYGI